MTEHTKNITPKIIPKFDPSLLLESDEKKREYFKNFKVPHDMLMKVHKEILKAIKGSKPIILVIGPTGVGKTTLMQGIEKELKAQYANTITTNPGSTPILTIDVKSSTKGKFNWSNFFRRVLKQLKYAFIKNQNEDDLGEVFEEAIKNRMVKVVLLDEGQHFSQVKANKDREIVMDFIKSLSNTTDTTYILFGTPRLIEFINLHGQVSRRGKEIHFPRYNNSNPKELLVFQKTLLTLLCHMPLEKIEDTILDWEYFYLRSMGCIGHLKTWLEDALAEALRTGSKKLTRKILDDTAYTADQLKTFWKEIKEHEKVMLNVNSKKKLDELKAEMGLSTNQSNKNKSAKQSKSIERAPNRDIVGQGPENTKAV